MLTDEEIARYRRHLVLREIGGEGQQRLKSASVLVVGAGGLGSPLIYYLAAAGLGRIGVIDDDRVSLDNLQRQILHETASVGQPKTRSAAAAIERLNPHVETKLYTTRLVAANALDIIRAYDIVADGSDNFATRYLLNDASIKFNIPWVYGGCIGAEGQTMTIIPGETPCLRCLMPEAPPPGSTPTCDTAGILGPIINVIASIEACEAIKILSGHREAINRTLTVFELWDNRIRQVKLDSLQGIQCETCDQQKLPWLDGDRGSHTAILCGRNAVQLSFPDRQPLSLERLTEKLSGVGEVTGNAFLLRLAVDDFLITVFPDGRAIIGGTEDITEAKTVYAKYIGN